MARPTTFKPEYVEQAKKLAGMGHTELEIAQFFGVAERTFRNWKQHHPELLPALKLGKAPADERVVRSLYHRAIGYTFESEKVFQHQGRIIRAKTVEHIPPDTAAAIFWLKNRDSKHWRDKHDHTVEGSLTTVKRIERVIVDPANPDA